MTDLREELGQLVRQVWIRWASEQKRPKRSWLTDWDQLDAGQREVDMRIGEAVYQHAMSRLMGELPALRAEAAGLQQRIEDLRAFEREYRGRLRAGHQAAIAHLDAKDCANHD